MMDVTQLFEELEPGVDVRRIRLSGASDLELKEISDLMAIGLSLDEMKRVRDYFKGEDREPNDIELEALGQAWSEHCCYKSSKYYMKKHFMDLEAPQTMILGEDAGVVEFDDEHAYVVGLESHNHPSAIGPYGGAATGVGGIIRDVVCMGAQPIAMVDPLFFGPLDTDNDMISDGVNHPKFIFSGVVAGIGDYGNRIGIPTVAGMVGFHPGFTGNPLVNVGCIGIARKEHVIRSRVGGPGEIYILAGGRTGRDGIHGVTFASADLSADSEEKDRGSVQMGDPITKEPIMHSCLEANENGLLRGMKDLGGGGLSCVSGEMALAGGCGAVIHLDRIPLKEKGLSPWEIWVSESQERMMVSVLPENVPKVLHIFDRWDVEAVVIGEVTREKRVKALWGDKVILDMDLDFFTEGPQYCRNTIPRELKREVVEEDFTPPDGEELDGILRSLLKDPNVCSKEMVFRTYDHEVRGRTVVKPAVGDPFNPGPSDASVLKPLESSWKGIAVTADVNPYFCEMDPYRGTLSALEEGVRNLVSVGARPHSITDCLNFGNPERPDRLWDFQRSCEAMGGIARHLGLPVVSGNVSLYNESDIGKVPPTPTVMMIGLIDDIRRCTTSDLKTRGGAIYLLGSTLPELGGSVYYRNIGADSGSVPDVDLELMKAAMELMLELNEKGLIRSAHDLSDGGLAVGISEMCIGGTIGAEIDIKTVGSAHEMKSGSPMRVDTKLFSESNSRYLMEVTPEDVEKVERIIMDRRVPYTRLGAVKGERLRISDGGEQLVDIPVKELDDAWRGSLRRIMGGSQ